MFRNVILIALGTAGAVYFLDSKKGPKRRKQFRKQFDEAVKVTGNLVDDYSHKLSEQATTYASVLNDRFGHYAKDAKVVAKDYVKNGNRSWAPSARMVGALGSALAFYGAGRRGPAGAILRTISLGLFTKALMTPR